MKRPLAFLLFVLQLTSCNKSDVPCNDCLPKLDSKPIAGSYFRYLVTSEGYRLIQYDSVTNESTEFPFCWSAKTDTVENTKILRVEGELVKSCNGAFDLVQMKKFRVIENCVEPFVEINQIYSLANTKWQIENIQSGSTWIPPCEGYSHVVFNSDNSFNGSMSLNFIGGNYSMAASDRIMLSNSIGIGLFVGTKTQTEFEKIFVRVFSYGATLEVTLNKNHLTLRNSSNNSIMNLHTK